jgi:hypothetical protein
MHMVATCSPTSCSVPQQPFQKNGLNRDLSRNRDGCSVEASPPHPKQNLGKIIYGGRAA